MLKATEIYLLMFAVVHLLYIGFSGYAHIFDAKVVTFCTINILYFICVLIFLFLNWDKKSNMVQKFRQSLSHAHICVLFYMGFTIISGFLSPNFPDTIFGVSRFEGVFTICVYCICFITVSLFPCRKKYILTAFAVSVTLFAALCIIQLSGFNPLHLYPNGTSFYDAGVRYTTAFIGTIGNTNLSGAFICLALPFLAVILLKAKSRQRFLLTIPVALLLFVALKMDVTSTLVGLLAGLIIAIPLLLGFGRKKTAIYISKLFVLILLITALLYFADLGGFFGEIHEILNGNISDTYGSGRIRIWRNVLSEIPDSPIFGKGPDTMMREAFTPFERYYPTLGKTLKTSIDVAHNEYLNILYHQGILGLAAYLGFIFFTLRTWLKNRHDTVILALGISVICYLVQSFFTFSMCLTAPYFWICAGLIHGLSNRKHTLVNEVNPKV